MAKGKASDWKWRVTDEVNQEIGDENGQDVTYSKSKLETRFSLEEKKKKTKKQIMFLSFALVDNLWDMFLLFLDHFQASMHLSSSLNDLKVTAQEESISST